MAIGRACAVFAAGLQMAPVTVLAVWERLSRGAGLDVESAGRVADETYRKVVPVGLVGAVLTALGTWLVFELPWGQLKKGEDVSP